METKLQKVLLLVVLLYTPACRPQEAKIDVAKVSVLRELLQVAHASHVPLGIILGLHNDLCSLQVTLTEEQKQKLDKRDLPTTAALFGGSVTTFDKVIEFTMLPESSLRSNVLNIKYDRFPLVNGPIEYGRCAKWLDVIDI